MTIRNALKEAENGNVQAMLFMADYYAQDVDQNGSCSVEKLKSALKWYEKAAQTGDPYAMEMTGATYTIFAETLLQIGAYEDSLEQWTQAYRYVVPLVQYPAYSLEKRQEMLNRARYSLYKTAYCKVLLDKYGDALDILEKMSPKPYSKEMMLKGICLFKIAEYSEDYEMAYEVLREFESHYGISHLRNAVDDVEEIVFSEAYVSLAILYRIGLANIRRDIEKAYDILCMALDAVSGERAIDFIQQELSHYKRKLFGGYQYVE